MVEREKQTPGVTFLSGFSVSRGIANFQNHEIDKLIIQ